jgi:hypothetical protein
LLIFYSLLLGIGFPLDAGTTAKNIMSPDYDDHGLILDMLRLDIY